MTKTLVTNLIVVLMGAASFVGCSKSVVPTAPSNQIPNSSGEFTLTGTVTGLTDGTMIALDGVIVSASNGAAQSSAVTDAEGSFSLGGLSAGEWTILLSKSGYADQSQTVTLNGDATVNFSLDNQQAALKHRARANRQ
jgi:hypothetical protein